MKTTYTPGPWIGVVRSDTVIVLDESTQGEIISELWEFLGEKPLIHEVLNKVTASFGTELTGMPAFGILTVGAQPRAVLRGEMSLTVRSGQTELEVSGREVTTWSERSLPAADLFTLHLGAASELPALLPLAEGVVKLSALQIGQAQRVSPAATLPAVASDTDAGQPIPGQPAEARPSSLPETVIAPISPLVPGLPVAPVQLPPLPESSATPVTPGEDDLSQTLVSSDVSEQHDDAEPAAPNIDLAAVEAPLPGSAATSQNVAADADEPLVTEAPDNTTSYDHLWDRTVSRSVEDAAIRADEDAEHEEISGAQLSHAQAELPLPGSASAVSEQVRALPEPDSASSLPAAARGAASTADQDYQPLNPIAPVAAPAPQGSGLIDSVPWMKASAQPPSEASAQAGLAAHPELAQAAQPAPSSAAHDSDHDGHTVMRSELELPEPPATEPQLAQPAPGTGVMVLARLCANGHASPPTYARCAHCGQPMLGDPRQVRRPVLGKMRISTGEVIDLDRSLVVGRQPSVSRVNGEGMPKLVQVRSQAGDISRSHVEVRLEGWDVVLIDLKATNGTVLVREGQPPRRLGQGEQALLLNGDIAELGEDVSLRFEGLL